MDKTEQTKFIHILIEKSNTGGGNYGYEEVRKNSFNVSWKEEYNMLLAREEMLLEEGVQKGRKEGKQEGFREGITSGYQSMYELLQKKVITLNQALEVVENKADFEAWYKKQK